MKEMNSSWKKSYLWSQKRFAKMLNNYAIRFTPSAKNDLVLMKKYIIHKFIYQEYAISFDKKVKTAISIIKNSPKSYTATEFKYREHIIYMRCINTYLFFYIVDRDVISILRVMREGMNWKYIMMQWIMNTER